MSNKSKLAFGKKNYIFMIIGLALLIVGFLIMSFEDGDYGFGFLGLTLGPVVVMAGFIVEFFAIMIKDKNKE